MSFVYGLAVLTYQKGLLKSWNWSAIDDTQGLYWLIPIITINMSFGIALDFDIFLFARIYEYRTIGKLSTRHAIVRGVYNSASIITAAGCIMAISFFGLLFSSIRSMNQIGFILIVAILLDTLVIRIFLAPAILSLAEEINWWPGSRNKKLFKDTHNYDRNFKLTF